jgi:KipI family sensor histidine kinase inhibitor
VRTFGERGFLVEPEAGVRPTTGWVLAVAGACRGLWPDCEVVPGLASVLVTRDVAPGRHSRDAAELRAALSQVAVPGEPAGVWPGAATHVIPVRYDGADLADVAAGLGVAPGDLVDRHSSALWTVAAIGFSPGFGYLTCPDPLFSRVARRADPRTRVPAGAVALAAGMCAVYPSPTPGGWQIIGRTELVMFDARAHPPARLRSGDRVRFVRQA